VKVRVSTTNTVVADISMMDSRVITTIADIGMEEFSMFSGFFYFSQ
jgi:hypothetical protein